MVQSFFQQIKSPLEAFVNNVHMISTNIQDFVFILTKNPIF